MVADWHERISQPQYGIKVEKDILVPMRDGVKLAINIYRPDAEGKFPALLALGPFGKDEQGIPLPPQSLYRSAIWDGNLEAGDSTYIVPRGYIHIIADIRGSGRSGSGFPKGPQPNQGGKDGYDLIEWIAQQPWCNGNVGMTGYSVYSNIQPSVAREHPPHLKAIYMAAVITDMYRDMAYHGGILCLFQYGTWDGRGGTSGFAQQGTAVSQMIRKLPPEELEHRRQALLNHPDILHFPNLYFLLLYPQKNPGFFDALMNPCDGPFWRDRAADNYYNQITVPVHLIGKWPHFFTKYWEFYNSVNVPKKITMKGHDPEERPWREDIDTVIRWYDHWLKGNNTGIMDEPPIKYYVLGSEEWRYSQEWPLPGIEYTKYYLRGWEGLSLEPEMFTEEPDGFFQQPLHLSNKRDCVQYLSPPLPQDLEVIGPAAFNFYASIDQEDTNWFVSLSDVSPNGSETMVTNKGYLKASHRKLDTAKSKPCTPWHLHTEESLETIVPGEIYEYNVDLYNMANVFKAGHRIKLVIESMESPRDPEMVIHFHPHLCSSKATVHKIYRNKHYQSHLLLPVIPKKKSSW
jgi:uncharacterized protein